MKKYRWTNGKRNLNSVHDDAPKRVAVVGAGIAGASCATVLDKAGISVHLIDKGRHSGGRIATRETPPWQWDHGAPSITAESEDFRQLLRRLPTWPDRPAISHVGSGKNNDIVQELFPHLKTTQNTRISQIFERDEGWHLLADTGQIEDLYDAVVLAVPAPQALALLPDPQGFAVITRVTMAPCWTLLIAAETKNDAPVMANNLQDDIALVTADHLKPGRSQHVGQYVLHASSAWSQAHLESTELDVAKLLLTHFNRIVDAQAVRYVAAHRWRYAQTTTPLGAPFILDKNRRLGVCGDWCLGARAEHGFISGTSLGHALAETLS